MDKYRKGVVELCAAFEIMDETANHGQHVMVDPNQWRLAKILVQEIKNSFNANLQFKYEQHYLREKDARMIAAWPEKEAQNGSRA